MNWIAWTIIGLHALGAAGTVLMVGRHREPTTPSTALLSLAINGAVIAGVVSLAHA